MTTHVDCCGYLFPTSAVRVRSFEATVPPDMIRQALAYAAELRDGRKRRTIDITRRWSALDVLKRGNGFQAFLDLAEGSSIRSRLAPAELVDYFVAMVRTFMEFTDSVRIPNRAPAKRENFKLAPADLRIAPLDSAPCAPPFSPSSVQPDEGYLTAA